MMMPPGSGHEDHLEASVPPTASAGQASITKITLELLATDAELRASYPVVLDLSAPRFQLQGSVDDTLDAVRPDVLRSLKLDGNAITSLEGVSRFASLRSLSARQNELAAAAPKCLRLQELYLGSNRLLAIPGLMGCPALRTLEVESNLISGGYEQLRHAPKLLRINLSRNQVGTRGTPELLELGRGLRAVPRLASLELEGNAILLLPRALGGVIPTAWLSSVAPKAYATKTALDLQLPGPHYCAQSRAAWGDIGAVPTRAASAADARRAIPHVDSATPSPSAATTSEPLALASEAHQKGDRSHASDAAALVREDMGGLFGVSLDSLRQRRACPPPLLAELDAQLLTHVTCAAKLAHALDASCHASMAQALASVSSAVDAQGAHGTLLPLLTPARLAGRPLSDAVPALGFGLLFQWLRELPGPVIPCEMYALVLSSSADNLSALLRKKLPKHHVKVIDAVGMLLGRVLMQCQIDVLVPGSPEDERAVHALLSALAPALLRPQPGEGIPVAEKAAAIRASRVLLSYHLQRQQYRALATKPEGMQPGAVAFEAMTGPGSNYDAFPSNVSAGPVSIDARCSPPQGCTGEVACMNCIDAVSAGGACASPDHACSRAVAMHSVRSSISAMFNREFRSNSSSAMGARFHAEIGGSTPAKQAGGEDQCSASLASVPRAAVPEPSFAGALSAAELDPLSTPQMPTEDDSDQASAQSLVRSAPSAAEGKSPAHIESCTPRRCDGAAPARILVRPPFDVGTALAHATSSEPEPAPCCSADEAASSFRIWPAWLWPVGLPSTASSRTSSAEWSSLPTSNPMPSLSEITNGRPSGIAAQPHVDQGAMSELRELSVARDEALCEVDVAEQQRASAEADVRSLLRHARLESRVTALVLASTIRDLESEGAGLVYAQDVARAWRDEPTTIAEGSWDAASREAAGPKSGASVLPAEGLQEEVDRLVAERVAHTDQQIREASMRADQWRQKAVRLQADLAALADGAEGASMNGALRDFDMDEVARWRARAEQAVVETERMFARLRECEVRSANERSESEALVNRMRHEVKEATRESLHSSARLDSVVKAATQRDTESQKAVHEARAQILALTMELERRQVVHEEELSQSQLQLVAAQEEATSARAEAALARTVVAAASNREEELTDLRARAARMQVVLDSLL